MAVPSLDDLKDYNPWMQGELFPLPAFKRLRYAEVYEVVGKRKFIVAVTGLRRVGKTVMLKQMGNELGGDRYFFSFEEDRFVNYDALRSVIEQFLRFGGDRPTIFLDEIGRIDGWAGLLKKYHDLGKASFVVSGSSSLQISKGKESLAGRLMEYNLPTWRFREYLGLKGHESGTYPLSDLERAYMKWDHAHEDDVKDFLVKGSFPELADETDGDLIKKYIRSTTVDKIIFEDIPKIFKIKNAPVLDEIFTYVCKNTGSILHPSQLGGALGVSKDTVKDYLHYLRHAYLAGFLPVEGSPMKSFRKMKKVYGSCASLSHALMDAYDEPRLVENAIFDKLAAECKDIRFFRDSHGHEVDFTGEHIIESKWKEKVTKGDIRSLLYYLSKKKLGEAYVIGKEFDTIRHGEATVHVLPLALFLLMDLSGKWSAVDGLP